MKSRALVLLLLVGCFPDADKLRTTGGPGPVIPGAGDSTVVAGWQLRVVRMDQRRVDRVAVAPTPERAQP